MKALTILFWILICFCFNNSFGQSGWFTQLSGGPFPSLWSVHFTDSNTGWTVGDGGTILKTTNGGTNWLAQSSGTTLGLASNYFINSNTGWAVGTAGAILKTTNGGANWLPQKSRTSQGLGCVRFVDINTGWAVGGLGTILKTTNGGATWFTQSSGTNIGFYECDFFDSQTGWIVGYGGTVVKTTNGGTNWGPQTSMPSTAWLWSVSFPDVNHGCAVGANTIYTTSNGGTNWTELNYAFNYLRGIYFVNDDTGWAVGGIDYIVKTTNGGINWIDQPGAGSNIQSVYFIDNKTGWVVGTDGFRGTIAKTTTGGAISEILPPSNLTAQSIDSSHIKLTWQDNSNNENGFYIERTKIVDSTQWEIIDVIGQDTIQYSDYLITRGLNYYYRVRAFSGNIYSDYSNIDSAVLGGSTMMIPEAPSNLNAEKISYKALILQWNDNSRIENGFIIFRKAQNDLFFRIIDSTGTDIMTYKEMGLAPDNFYKYKICAFNQSGISDFSNVLTVKTLGNADSEKQFYNGLPSNNYPNPFNPSTTISFEISEISNVKLSVFDITGKEVAVLVNEQLQPGSFSYRFDGSKFASGVYFYKIRAGDFVQVKRMILIK